MKSPKHHSKLTLLKRPVIPFSGQPDPIYSILKYKPKPIDSIDCAGHSKIELVDKPKSIPFPSYWEDTDVRKDLVNSIIPSLEEEFGAYPGVSPIERRDWQSIFQLIFIVIDTGYSFDNCNCSVTKGISLIRGRYFCTYKCYPYSINFTKEIGGYITE